ncbi:MAG: hypothetical protein CMN31_01180 [Sandaracinus sp.]|nr:hypothetical protein [Sandaracinus sp.]MBJ69975.1 hypothetical protein [Sandaracinus sp.]
MLRSALSVSSRSGLGRPQKPRETTSPSRSARSTGQRCRGSQSRYARATSSASSPAGRGSRCTERTVRAGRCSRRSAARSATRGVAEARASSSRAARSASSKPCASSKSEARSGLGRATIACRRLCTRGPTSARGAPVTSVTQSVESSGVKRGTGSVGRRLPSTRAVRAIISR